MSTARSSDVARKNILLDRMNRLTLHKDTQRHMIFFGLHHIYWHLVIFVLEHNYVFIQVIIHGMNKVILELYIGKHCFN